jgi:hypothetical protein
LQDLIHAETPLTKASRIWLRLGPNSKLRLGRKLQVSATFLNVARTRAQEPLASSADKDRLLNRGGHLRHPDAGALTAVTSLRENFPDLKIHLVNVADLERPQPLFGRDPSMLRKAAAKTSSSADAGPLDAPTPLSAFATRQSAAPADRCPPRSAAWPARPIPARLFPGIKKFAADSQLRC